jgi:hypothetical protein
MRFNLLDGLGGHFKETLNFLPVASPMEYIITVIASSVPFDNFVRSVPMITLTTSRPSGFSVPFPPTIPCLGDTGSWFLFSELV